MAVGGTGMTRPALAAVLRDFRLGFDGMAPFFGSNGISGSSPMDELNLTRASVREGGPGSCARLSLSRIKKLLSILGISTD